jgi:Spy/CpxP family protein refolding chaperone
MKREIPVILIVLSVALNLGFVGSWAWGALRQRSESAAGCGMMGQANGASCGLHQELGVSDQQWREIAPRLAEFRERADTISHDSAMLRLDLLNLLSADSPDQKAIQAKQDEIAANQRRMQEEIVAHLLREKQTLTAEQERKLFGLMRERCMCANCGHADSQDGAGECMSGCNH